MEKDNTRILENIEQKENNSERKEQTDKKRKKHKKILFFVLGIILLLCIVVMVLQETGVINKHVHIKVENIMEGEEISYNDLIFSYSNLFLDEDSQMWKSRHLCIFNTGDIYYLELPQELYWLSKYDENLWEGAENVIYIGRLSNSTTETLNQYVENYDDDEGYIIEIIDPGHYVGYDPYADALNEAKAASSSESCIFWQGDDDESEKSQRSIAGNTILYFGLNNSDHNTFETWRTMLTREENAIAAARLFESTGFYYRWVAMCFEEFSR